MHRRWATNNRILFLTISLLVFVLINWGVWRIFNQPDLGFLWSRDTGVVYQAPNHPIIQVGDIIKTIDGIPTSESQFPYYFWERGDIIAIQYERTNEIQDVRLTFESNAPPAFFVGDLLLLIVSLSFWLVGLWVSQAQSSASKIVFVFWAFCMNLALLIAIGSVNEPSWVGHFTVTLVWFAVPLAISLHLLFPRIYRGGWKYILNLLLYSVAVIGSILTYATTQSPALFEDRLSILARIGEYAISIWLILGLLASMLLLIRTYVVAKQPEQRRQVGIILICYFVGIAPLLFLYTLPSLFGLQQSLSSEFTLLFLVFIPIGYGYTISSYKMMNLEHQVSRSLSVLFPLLILTYIYLLIQNLTQNSERLSSLLPVTFLNVATFVIGVIIFNPMKNRLRKFVDKVFFDGWYDYSSVVGAVTYELSNSSDLESLTESLISTIQSAMRVHWSVLLTQRPYENQLTPKIAGDTDRANLFDLHMISSSSELINTLFLRSRPTGSQTLKELYPNCFTDEENALLSHPDVRLWVPIEGVDHYRAVLVLGPKRGGESFDEEDMSILNVVAKQASIALKNAQLIDELAQKAEESDQYQRQLVTTRFEERKRIARNVHDDFIQELVGFKYQIAHAGDENELLEERLSMLIKKARSICQDLRPPALDLGLIAGIRSLITQFEVNHNTQVNLLVQGNQDINVDDYIGICIMQCTRETLSNIAKHAQADLVEIFLDFSDEAVVLKIQDNGVGFDVPKRIGSLMKEDHFGIVGMREHVELVRGQFELHSAVSQGTCLTITVPMQLDQGHEDILSLEEDPSILLKEVKS